MWGKRCKIINISCQWPTDVNVHHSVNWWLKFVLQDIQPSTERKYDDQWKCLAECKIIEMESLTLVWLQNLPADLSTDCTNNMRF